MILTVKARVGRGCQGVREKDGQGAPWMVPLQGKTHRGGDGRSTHQGSVGGKTYWPLWFWVWVIRDKKSKLAWVQSLLFKRWQRRGSLGRKVGQVGRLTCAGWVREATVACVFLFTAQPPGSSASSPLRWGQVGRAWCSFTWFGSHVSVDVSVALLYSHSPGLGGKAPYGVWGESVCWLLLGTYIQAVCWLSALATRGRISGQL